MLTEINQTEIVRPANEPTLEEIWANGRVVSDPIEDANYVLARAVRFECNELRREGDEDAVAWATRRLKKAFTPVTNARKIANGRTPYDTLLGVLGRSSSSIYRSKMSEGIQVRMAKISELVRRELRS